MWNIFAFLFSFKKCILLSYNCHLYNSYFTTVGIVRQCLTTIKRGSFFPFVRQLTRLLIIFELMEITFFAEQRWLYPESICLSNYTFKIIRLSTYHHSLSMNFKPQRKLLTWCVGYQKFLAPCTNIRQKEFELLSKFGIHNLNQPKYVNL